MADFEGCGELENAGVSHYFMGASPLCGDYLHTNEKLDFDAPDIPEDECCGCYETCGLKH